MILSRRRLFYLVRFVLLCLFALIILAPILWIVLTAFKRQIDILMARFLFTPTLKTIIELLGGSLGSNMVNSAVVAISATTLILAMCSLACYTLTTTRTTPQWVGSLLLGWCLVFNMVPGITFIGSWFSLFNALGLYDTRTALVIASIGSYLPMALWLGMTFAREVPATIMEAAEIDGCSHGQRFLWVFMPLIRNSLIATAILVFLFIWNDFPIALVLTSETTRTLPVAITSFAQMEQVRYAEMAASSVLTSLPAFILLLIGQRFIVRGLLSGALK